MRYIVCCCYLLLLCAVRGGAQPQCNAALFQSLAPQASQSATLLYSSRGTRCDAQFAGNSYLDCGTGNTATYTSISIAMATSGPGGSDGVCANFTLGQMAPLSTACYQYYAPPPQQPTVEIQPLYVGVALTRAFIYYPLTAVGPYTVPFTYAQFGGDNDTAGVCDTAAAACSQAELQQVPQALQCDASYIFATWQDTGTATAVQQNCGALSDLPQSILESDPSLCQAACCAACNDTGTSPTNYTRSWRRWPVGPEGQVFRPGSPQLRVFGAVIVSNRSDFAGGEVVAFQSVVTGEDGQLSFIGGLQSNQDYVSVLRHVRVRVNQARRAPAALQQLDGYVVRFRYGAQTDSSSSCDMGAGNPYARTKQPSPCLSRLNATLAQLVPPVVPADASPMDLGAGTVPTQTSLGNLSQCSFFWLPSQAALDGMLIVPSPTQFRMPVSQQASQLWPSLVDPFASQCPYTSTDPQYFAQYQGLPGWELNQSSGLPLTKSGCQMSNDCNVYSQTFLGFLNGDAMGNATLAMELAGPPPESLFPGYVIATPNVWWHDNSLVYDIGLTYPAQTGYEVLAQVVDQVFVHQQQQLYLYALTASTLCGGNPLLGTGFLQPVVTTLSDEPVLQGPGILRINCSTVVGVNASVFYVNNTTPVTNSELTINLVGGTTSVVRVLHLRFPAAAAAYNSVAPPFLACTLQLLDPTFMRPYSEARTFACVRQGNASNVLENIPEQAPSVSTLAFYIGIAVIIGALVLIAVGGIIAAVAARPGTPESM